MDNNFATHHHNCLDLTHQEINQRINKSQEKENEADNINKETNNKSIWQSFNIFSKIKRSSKAKIKETGNIDETQSEIVCTKIGNNESLKKCKSNEMSNKSDDENNDMNGTADDTINKPVEPKASFFGKLNLESFLKIFADLHKKKQSQASLCTTETKANTNVKNTQSNPATMQNVPIEPINAFQAIQQYDSYSNNSIFNDNAEICSVHTEDLQNPHNSPSVTNSNINKDNSVSTCDQINLVANSDSTLSLLENVRIKLKDYLLNETNDKIDKLSSNQISTALCEKKEFTENVTAAVSDTPVVSHVSQNIVKKSEITNTYTNSEVNELSAYPTELIQRNTGAEGSNDNKLAYTIVEGDIKCMIKELLKESKDIKSSIVASGIEEEPTPLFTIVDNCDPFLVCQGICADVINLAANKPRSILKGKNKAITHVTFKTETNAEIESLLTNLLETVLSEQTTVKSKPVYVNFCLIQNTFKNKKHAMDINTAKFRGSKVYHLTKKLRKMPVSSRKVPLTPRVTVHNLSAGNHIKFLSIENSLTNRIRRSAALLMALYDEMRDYSYYSCTSNILCDLYESMIKQGLISVITEKINKSIENLPANNNVLSENTDQNTNNVATDTVPEKTEEYDNACSSCYSNPSSAKVLLSPSKDSFSSESDEEEREDGQRKLLLPNLTYTNQSDEEINTPEEIKAIEDNISKNKGKCEDMNIIPLQRTSEDSIDMQYEDVPVNESGGFS